MGTLTEKNLELAEFLKTQSIFQVLEQSVVESLSVLFSEIVCGPGQIIFREGDAPDGLYVVKSGSVAVLKEKKVIAYLTAGECFGEMAIVQETPRTATIRVPEEAIVLRLPTSALKEVTRNFPAITEKITDVIERRSQGRTTFKPPGLQGNLAFFDLPTVIQTVISSKQDGILSLYGRTGRTIGKLILKASSIADASFDHLKGEHALYELLNSTEPLDFTFDQMDCNDTEADKNLIRRPPHMLLIEGARRADELAKLLENVGWPGAMYIQLKTVPDLAQFPERKDLLRSLWNLIEMGCNTESICRQIPYDRYSILSILDEILNLKWVRMEAGPKATDEIKRRTGQYSKPNLQELMKKSSGTAKSTSSISMDKPLELVRVINSFNGISTNLGTLYGKVEVRMILLEALAKAVRVFPVLQGLKVHIDSPCLDMRSASSEFSESPDSVAGILLLGNYLMDLLVKMQNL